MQHTGGRLVTWSGGKGEGGRARWSDYWIQSDSPLSAIKTQAIWNHNEVTQAATKPHVGNYSVQILHARGTLPAEEAEQQHRDVSTGCGQGREEQSSSTAPYKAPGEQQGLAASGQELVASPQGLPQHAGVGQGPTGNCQQKQSTASS